MFDEHQVSIKDLYSRLESNAEGLSDEEADRRLQEHGLNELHIRHETSEIVKFLRQFRNFFAVLLMIGGALAFLADYLDPGQGNFYIGCALYGVVLLNAVFTYIQEYQSEQIMESFRKMLPNMVTIQRNGDIRRINAKDVVPGDIMLLYEGNRISADGRLTQCSIQP